jgi:hypothetical protein
MYMRTSFESVQTYEKLHKETTYNFNIPQKYT